MKLITNVLAALLLGVISSSAIAEGSKFYGAVDLGKSMAKNRCDGFSAASGWSCAESATAIRIAGGYQITPTWGVEASYGNYGTLKDTYSSPTTTINTEVKLNGFAIHATGTLPINEAFSLFGKLGIARNTVKGSSTSSNPAYSATSNEATSTKASFGIGAQYAITQKVALRAQYDDFGSFGDSNVRTMKITLLSAGVVVKF